MGEVLKFECKECRFEEEFFVGGGILTMATGKWYMLYKCPKCDNLSVRERASEIEEEQICERCNSIMEPLNHFSYDGKLACPNCHGQNCEMKDIGCWD